MNKFFLIKDSDSGLVFAVVATTASGVHCVGNMKQGNDWASWANSSKITYPELMASLDPSLEAGDPIQLDDSGISQVVSQLNGSTATQLMNMVPRVALVVEKKSAESPKDEKEENNNEDEYELVYDWPLTDVALSLVDVEFKTIAVEYKASAFINKRASSSMLLGIKGVRAIWDPDFPGGGAWRCPPESGDTAGQFTDRFGRGCLPGVARRIGNMMMSIKPNDSDFGATQLGRVMGSYGEMQQQSRLLRASRRARRSIDRQSRRTERRVRKLEQEALRNVESPSVASPSESRRAKRKRRLSDRLNEFAERISPTPDTGRPTTIDQPVTRRASRRARKRSATSAQQSSVPAQEQIPDQEVLEPRRKKRGAKPKRPPITQRIADRLVRAGEDFEAGRERQPKRAKRGESGSLRGESMRQRLVSRLESFADKITQGETNYKKPKYETLPRQEIKPVDVPRKPTPVTTPTSVGARVREVAVSKTSPRKLLYGNIVPSKRIAATLLPFDQYTPQEQALLIASAQKARTLLADGWRKRLKLKPGEELTEDAIDDWLTKLAQKSPRKAAIVKNQGHNAIVLDDFLSDLDSNPTRDRNADWAAIKPAMREWIVDDSGIAPRKPAKQKQPKSQRGQTVIPVAPTRPKPKTQDDQGIQDAQDTQDAAITPEETEVEEISVSETPQIEEVQEQAEEVQTEIPVEEDVEQPALPRGREPLALPRGSNVVDSTSEHGSIEAKENANFQLEKQTGLLRDPESGMYKEDYKDFPVSIDNQIAPLQQYPPMQRSRKSGAPVVSYPKFNNSFDNSLPQGQVSYAPNTHEKSVSTWKQARESLIRSQSNLPESFKTQNPTIIILTIPRDENGNPQAASNALMPDGTPVDNRGNAFFSEYTDEARNSYWRRYAKALGVGTGDVPEDGLVLALDPMGNTSWRGRSGDSVTKVIEAVNKALLSNSGSDWYDAWKTLSGAHTSALMDNANSLNSWRNAPKESAKARYARTFIVSGELAEILEEIATRIFPSKFPFIINAIRDDLASNAMNRNRIARARVAAQEAGKRTVGGVDQVKLLPQIDENGSYILRTPEELLDLYEKNRTYGLFSQQPLTVVDSDPRVRTELSEEQIDALSIMQKAYDDGIDIRNMQPARNSNHAFQLAVHVLNGSNDPAVVATQEEVVSLLQQVDQYGNPMYIPLVRGIGRVSDNKSIREMINDYIEGERYVTAGTVGEAGGPGDNFSSALTPVWGYEGEGDGSIFALVPRSARMIFKDLADTLSGQASWLMSIFSSLIKTDNGKERSADSPLKFQSSSLGYNSYYNAETYDSQTLAYIASNGIRIPSNLDSSDANSLLETYNALLAAVEDQRLYPDNDSSKPGYDFSMSTNGPESWKDSPPIGGSEWFRRTRAEIFGWFVQLEIAKGALIAQGLTESDPQVQRLLNAQRAIYYSGLSQSILKYPILGIDVYVSGSSETNDMNQLKIHQSIPPGRYGVENHVMVVNRNGLILLNVPTSIAKVQQLMQDITVRMPDGTTKQIYSEQRRR